MKNIILNYLPPASLEHPSAGLSILKAFLQENGLNSKIIYWNILTNGLLSGFKRDHNSNTDLEIIPFLSLLLDKYKDKNLENSIKAILFSKSESNGLIEKNLSDDLLDHLKSSLTSIIDLELEKIESKETILFGFSSKFNQWIPASVLSSITKAKFPTIKTVIGGFSSKDEALAVMNICDSFDFAIWGEGEYPLLELSKQILLKEEAYDNISRLIYRKENEISIALQRTNKYLDFGNILTPNYDDYFNSIGDSISVTKFLPFETTRGCYWGRCKFCVETYGIKYRQKLPQQILEEMKLLSIQYDTIRFSFLDSDTVGKNINQFESFLDLLIKAKKDKDEHYDIIHAEIVPENFNSSLIKKMVLAGFKSVQIGYEAVTDTLLQKMDKRNRFADNLLFVKFAIKYGLNVISANIITGIITETDKDIYESIENLHFLRFFIDKGIFELNETLFRLYKGSKFYKSLSENQKVNWTKNEVSRLLPKAYIEDKSRFDLFGFDNEIRPNMLWSDFIDINDYYTQNKYTYRLIKNNGVIFYEELLGDIIIKKFIFNEIEYWDVLQLANGKIISLDDLTKKLEAKYNEISANRVSQIISELKSEYLLYCNSDKNEIISIIDTSELKI